MFKYDVCDGANRKVSDEEDSEGAEGSLSPFNSRSFTFARLSPTHLRNVRNTSGRSSDSCEDDLKNPNELEVGMF